MFAGLQAELYYVRDGVINTYALNFVVPIPANISELEFSWQSLIRQPVSTTSLAFSSSLLNAHAKVSLASPNDHFARPLF